ncbi:MAG: polyprenol phosphomannose-dependent alpha 1,6 mannosyltransferase MptB [Candidatus Levybacteria bacterium]|nr:polyprenol phosphomannose-dependent alpha 1,6 mannosyltransferase MptB [Candidatus Levybacteria bacterium]
MQKFLITSWIFFAVLLLLYSFTQVDLSLTLSQLSIWQEIQRSFQQIGYFQRPLSTLIFLLIAVLMFALYALTLVQVKKKKISRRYLFGIVLAISGILFFSYNAFSYDLFNYIFDAKIFTFYFQNPYFHKPLDFPQDPMLSFMHWTHRVYPYGPTWLFLTIPLSFFGFNIFLLTFYLFKFLSVVSFVAAALLIEKIAKKIGVNSLFAVGVFSLNPLVIIESLVSSHNDIVMVAFGLLSLFMFFERKFFGSLFWLMVSIGVKFATVFMLPAYFAKKFFEVNNTKFFLILTLSMLVALFLATLRTTFQPWYFLFVLPFSAFISEKKYILIPTFVISLSSLIFYAPFLYFGNWDPPIPTYLNALMISSIVVSILIVIVVKISNVKH